MTSRRILVHDADSVNQRIQFSQEGKPNYWYSIFAGQFRTAILYGGQLVLLDTQVFDGAVLLRLGPSGVSEMLASDPSVSSIAISLRAASAKASLRKLSSRTFDWQVRKLGWSESTIEKRQRAWTDAIDDGQFEVFHRDVSFPFSDELRKRLAENMPDLPASLANRLSLIANRSLAHAEIERATLARADEITARHWWGSSYMDVIALQHQGIWMEIDAPPGAPTTDEVNREKLIRNSTPIPPTVVDRLALMSSGQFAALRAGNRGILSSFHEKPNFGNRLRLGLVVIKATDSPKPLVDLLLTMLRVSSWGLVAFFVVTPPSSLWSPLWATIAVIGAAVIQIPLTDLLPLTQYLRADHRSFIRRPIG